MRERGGGGKRQTHWTGVGAAGGGGVEARQTHLQPGKGRSRGQTSNHLLPDGANLRPTPNGDPSLASRTHVRQDAQPRRQRSTGSIGAGQELMQAAGLTVCSPSPSSSIQPSLWPVNCINGPTVHQAGIGKHRPHYPSPRYQSNQVLLYSRQRKTWVPHVNYKQTISTCIKDSQFQSTQ